jgi:hypothetical protein
LKRQNAEFIVLVVDTSHPESIASLYPVASYFERKIEMSLVSGLKDLLTRDDSCSMNVTRKDFIHCEKHKKWPGSDFEKMLL